MFVNTFTQGSLNMLYHMHERQNKDKWWAKTCFHWRILCDSGRVDFDSRFICWALHTPVEIWMLPNNMNFLHGQRAANTLRVGSRFTLLWKLKANPDSSFYISSSQFWWNLNQREEGKGGKRGWENTDGLVSGGGVLKVFGDGHNGEGRGGVQG